MVVEIVDVVVPVALAESRKGLPRLAPTLGARGLELDRELN